VIVFINMRNLVRRAKVNGNNGKGITPRGSGLDASLPWEWRTGVESFSSMPRCLREICNLALLEKVLDDVNGVMFDLDEPLMSPQQIIIQDQWFCSDWYHFAKEGDRQNATGIASTLQNSYASNVYAPVLNDSKRLGAWGLGDQCYNWYFQI
jgi:hypothetical protein